MNQVNDFFPPTSISNGARILVLRARADLETLRAVVLIGCMSWMSDKDARVLRLVVRTK